MNPDDIADAINIVDDEDNELDAGDLVSEEEDPVPDVLPEAPESGFYGGDDAA
jgi:hypothetical protein